MTAHCIIREEEEQSTFRTKRQTEDHIFSLQMMFKKARNKVKQSINNQT